MATPKKHRRAATLPESAKTRHKRLLLAISLALAVLTTGVYGAVRSHDFLQFDDAAYVTENGAVRAGLTAAGLRWALAGSYAGNWHPLTWVSHMADVELFGLDPGWHHITNLLLHVLTTLLLFRLLARVTGSVGASAFVAALFAVHPLHVESVAWIAERKDVLSTFWWVLALTAYVGYVRRPAYTRYALLVVCFGLALLSKPMVVTLPLVLLLLDVWPLGRWTGGREGSGTIGAIALIKEKIPLFAMAAAAAIITFLVQRHAGAVQSLDTLPLSLRIAKIPIAYLAYLASTVWPAKLAVLYPYPASIPLWQSAAATAILLGITVWVWRVRRSRPYLLVGWFWFLATLVPVIGLVQAGSQPYADRFMYVPAIGLFVMVAWTAAQWAAARPQWARPVATAGVVVVLAAAALTYRQVAFWKDSVTLWEHAVAVTRDNYRAQANLGFALAEAGQRNAAVTAYQEALRLNPAYPNTHNYLGVLLSDMGNYDRAAAEFEEAIRLRPTFAEAHNNLGLARVNQDRVDDAIREFSEALRLDPGFAPARNNRAIAYVRKGDYARAIPEFEEAVRQQPGSAESHMNLAAALAASGKKRDALPHFEAAARAGGDPIKVHYAWGGVLMELGDMTEAAAQFQRALAINPGYAPAVHDLGLSWAQSGRLNEALEALQSAVQLDPGNADYHHDFGAALARRGLIPQAIAEMRAALRIDPSHAEAQEALRLLTRK